MAPIKVYGDIGVCWVVHKLFTESQVHSTIARFPSSSLSSSLLRQLNEKKTYDRSAC